MRTLFRAAQSCCCSAVHGYAAAEALFAQFEPMGRAQASADECLANATAHWQPCCTAQECCCCKPDSTCAMRARWKAALLLCILCGPRGPAQGCTHSMQYSSCRHYNVMVAAVAACDAAHATSLITNLAPVINCQSICTHLHVNCTTCPMHHQQPSLLLNTRRVQAVCWAPTNAHPIMPATMNSRRPTLSSPSAANSRHCLYYWMYTRRT